MPIEVAVLGWAAVLLALQFVLMASANTLQLGLAYTSGPRDERREPTGMAGRLSRAFDNMIVALMFFSVAVVVVTLGNAASSATALAAKCFLGARIAYIPAYVSGIPLLRSVIWIVGFFATLFMVLQALL